MQSKFLYFQVVEAEHLSHETKINELKENIKSNETCLSKEQIDDTSRRLESSILRYNKVCSNILGKHFKKVNIIFSIQNIFYSDTKTRYESSILLWEQFILSTSDTSAWVYETQEKLAVIRSSTLDTKTLLEEIKVSDTG